MYKYRRNEKILHRKEGDKFLLFNPYERYYIYLSPDIFDFWINMEFMESYLKNKKLSQSSFQVLISRLLKDHLIFEVKKYE